MANTLYPNAKKAMLSPGLDLVNGYVGSGSAAAPAAAPLKAVLLAGAGAAYNATHEFLSSLSAAIVGTAVALTNKTVASGVLNADGVTFASVPAGSTVTAVALFLDTGNPATSRLIGFVDTLTGGTALSIATNGGNVTINWDTGANKIFAL